MPTGERIKWAAISCRGKVYTGRAHASIMKAQIDARDPWASVEGVCGFVTNRGKFVDRLVARRIAFHAGQLADNDPETGILQSFELELGT